MSINRLLPAIVWLGIALTSNAQHHRNIWLRATVSAPVTEKIKVHNELQHRRQNGHHDGNMFAKHLMFSYRTWVTFRHNEDISFLVSPFAMFRNYRVISSQTDETVQPVDELRLAAAVDMRHAVGKGLYLTDRTGVESRFIRNDQHYITRGRNRFGISYMINEHLALALYDELLFNLTGVTASHFFDHDRLGFDLEYHVLKNLKVDMGYLHITRLPLSSPEPFSEHTIFVHSTISIGERKK